MRNLAFLFAGALLFIFAGCGKKTTMGNGKVVFQNRDLKGYKSISISGAYDVYLKKGDVESFVLETDENLLNVIKTEITGTTLNVYNSENIIRSKDLKLIITNPQLNSLDFSGSIELTSDTGLVFKDLRINISGVGRIDMNLLADNLMTSASGGADITFKGKAQNFQGTISGTGNIDAENLQVEESRIEISGLGKAKLNVNKKLDVNISGFGKVDYKGNPTINQVISGAGKVNKIN